MTVTNITTDNAMIIETQIILVIGQEIIIITTILIGVILTVIARHQIVIKETMHHLIAQALKIGMQVEIILAFVIILNSKC